jgi:hypothetical protein
VQHGRVALAPFLRSCPGIITLGVRPTIADYSAQEQSLLRGAVRIFFPTRHYAYLFHALKRSTFPAYTTYRFQHSRVLQQILFAYLQMPRPLTRICFGERQKRAILKAFSFPFVAMGPRAAVQEGCHRIENPTDFDQCCRCYNPIIIQEAVDWTERLRFLCVGEDCVGVLRQIIAGFRASSGSWGAPYVPAPLDEPELQPVLRQTREFVRRVHLDDMTIEWGYGNGAWQLIGMTRPPVHWPMPVGVLNRHDYICRLVQSGDL